MNDKNKKNSGIWFKLIFVFIIACFTLTVSVFLIISERPTHSDSEKRDLAEKPKFSFSALLDGSYFEALQTYYNDTVPMRETFKVWGSKILTYKGTVSDNGLIFVPVVIDKTPEPMETDAPTEEPTLEPTATPEPTWTPSIEPGATEVPETPTPTPTPTPTTAPTATPTPQNENDFWINEYGVVFYNGRGMDLYGGTKDYMKRYTDALNKLHSKRPDLNIYSMACPLACAYYLPRSVYSGTGNQEADINTMNAMLDSSIKTVDVYHVLEQHTDEYIYFKTDHHWSYLGAYYATQEFCKVAGVPFDDLSTFTAKKQTGWLGSLYSTYKLNQLANYPDEVTYYVTSRAYTVEYYNKDMVKFDYLSSLYSEKSKGYSVIIGGNDGVVTHVTTNAGTGRTLVVLKDSFGNATISYLLAGFDEIYMVDCRYFNPDIYEYLDTWGATDVLVVGDVFMQCSSLSNYVRNILNK